MIRLSTYKLEEVLLSEHCQLNTACDRTSLQNFSGDLSFWTEILGKVNQSQIIFGTHYFSSDRSDSTSIIRQVNMHLQ